MNLVWANGLRADDRTTPVHKPWNSCPEPIQAKLAAHMKTMRSEKGGGGHAIPGSVVR